MDRSLVKESLKSYAASATLAKTLAFYPLTLKSLKPWFLHDALAPLLKNLNQRSNAWLGRSGVGKSPASKIAGFTWSRYVIEPKGRGKALKPSLRIAKRMDFFRGELWTIFIADISTACSASNSPTP